MASASRASAWMDYRIRRVAFWLLLLPGIALTVYLAFEFLVEHHGLGGLLWPLLAWAVLVVLAGLHLQAFRCPRCQHRFFARSPLLLALRARRCANCSMPKE